MAAKRKIKKRKNNFVPIIIISIILLGILSVNITLRSTLQTSSRADEAPTPTGPDCTSDPQREDYCGDNAPFRGCNSPPAEWICQCRLPSGKWWSECSVAEDAEGKQKWLTQCGGDNGKALLQWKYDIAIIETEGKCSCGGQNVCGSLVKPRATPVPKSFPSPQTPIWPTQLPLVTAFIPTLIPRPTFTYQVPAQPEAPKVIYIPPTNPPIIYPTSPEQPPTIVHTQKSISMPQVKINFDGVNKFFADTSKSIAEFLSHVLP